MCDIALKKQALRKKMGALRRNLSSRREKSVLLQQHILGEDFFQNCDMLFTYLPLKSEAETFLLMEEAFRLGKTVAAPRCLSDGEMEFFVITSLNDLSAGSYGILEPEANEKTKITPTKNSLILVPGLAFDRKGYRLGYGKGYYDRYLAKHPANTVGLCFFESVLNVLPRGEHDLAVKHLATEEGILLFENERG